MIDTYEKFAYDYDEFGHQRLFRPGKCVLKRFSKKMM
jgi:hypothetical protein